MRELRGPAIAIAAVIVVFTAALAAMIVVIGWTSLSVYGFVKLFGSGSDDPDAAGILIAMALIVTTLVGLLAGIIQAHRQGDGAGQAGPRHRRVPGALALGAGRPPSAATLDRDRHREAVRQRTGREHLLDRP